MYKKIMNGSISEITSGFDTLLIGFGRNLARNMLRKKSEEYVDVLPDKADEQTPFSLLDAKTEKRRIRNILALAGPDCQKVLTLFYFFQKSMKEIAEDMSYSSADMAKKKKYQCLKKLKSKVNKDSWN
ncbi:MAG: sigma-70 family RNA polymerase sigma factor [Bacteroidia bacterium]|nr:sigma-70 family RNA polymerase sigma factor [Bacteroidia bacterium]